MAIRGKPDVDAYLEGGAGERTASAKKSATKKGEKPINDNVPKKQKLVELPLPVFDAIKDRAYREYKATGERVTDTDIIIAALCKYLNVKL